MRIFLFTLLTLFSLQSAFAQSAYTVVTKNTNTPVVAKVSIEKQDGKILDLITNGNGVFFSDLTEIADISFLAPNHLWKTIYNYDFSQPAQTFNLKKQPTAYQHKGLATGYKNLKRDGYITASIILPKISLSHLRDFQVDHILSPEKDLVVIKSRLGDKQIKLISNLAIPRQKEKYSFVSFNINKPTYTLPVNDEPEKELVSLTANISVNKLINSQGKGMLEMLSHANIYAYGSIRSKATKIGRINAVKYPLTSVVDVALPENNQGVLSAVFVEENNLLTPMNISYSENTSSSVSFKIDPNKNTNPLWVFHSKFKEKAQVENLKLQPMPQEIDINLHPVTEPSLSQKETDFLVATIKDPDVLYEQHNIKTDIDLNNFSFTLLKVEKNQPTPTLFAIPNEPSFDKKNLSVSLELPQIDGTNKNNAQIHQAGMKVELLRNKKTLWYTNFEKDWTNKIEFPDPIRKLITSLNPKDSLEVVVTYYGKHESSKQSLTHITQVSSTIQ